MGYMHIENLYKNQNVLLFKELYALEKLHGTSAHIAWTPLSPTDIGGQAGSWSVEKGMLVIHKVTPNQEQDYFFLDEEANSWLPGKLTLFSGGASINVFEKMYNLVDLASKLFLMNVPVFIHGELYGGSQQKQSYRYGSQLKFCVFDVRINQSWLTVPDAQEVTTKLGLEFVPWKKIPATVEACDAARDAFSAQAKRNGVEGDQFMEGVVLRPLLEVTDNRGQRIIAKHKRAEERETATERKVEDPSKLQALADAAAIANEWVTETRLDHVLDKLPHGLGISSTGDVLKAMVEDVMREGAGEIVDSKEARNAISARTRQLFHARVKQVK